MTLRIIHVYGHGYGGSFVINQVLSLHARGHSVSVVVPENGPFVERLQARGIHVEIIPFGGSRLRQVPRIVKSLVRLVRYLRSERPDVVHTHLIKANLVGRIAAKLAGRKVVLSQLGGPLPLEIAHFRWLDLLTAWIDDRILASSEAIARIYRRYPHTRNKVDVIYYGFDPAPFLADKTGASFRDEVGVAQDAFVVGMVAHMYTSHLRRFREIGLKGHEVLLAAAARVKCHDPGIRVIIVGEDIIPGGGYRARLERLARDLDVVDTVIFAGHRPDVTAAIAAMDVVVVPSLSENLGGAVEPLLMQRPVIASDVGGLPEVVIDGKTGFLVPPRDSAALADAILQMTTLTPEQRAQMGATGRAEVMRRFELSHTIDQLERSYYAAIDSWRARSTRDNLPTRA